MITNVNTCSVHTRKMTEVYKWNFLGTNIFSHTGGPSFVVSMCHQHYYNTAQLLMQTNNP